MNVHCYYLRLTIPKKELFIEILMANSDGVGYLFPDKID